METTTKTEMYAKCMMEVTPQMAAEWLATNPNNRSVNRNDVRRYAKKMQENDWIPNNDFISIESNGTLINGQHRLNAVILANRPVKLNVLFNAVRTPYYDTGRNRSLRDQIIMGGLAQAGTYATNRNVIGTARLCLRDIGGSTFKKADAYEILDWCHRHLEESKLIVDLGKIKPATGCNLKGIKANAIYLACASAVYAEIDPDIVKAWYEIAVTGLPLLEDNGLPMENPMTFRTWLVNNHSATVEGKIREIKAAQYSIVQYSKGNAMRKCIVPEQYVCEIPL